MVAEALEATGGSDAMMAMTPPEATANLAFREPTAQTASRTNEGRFEGLDWRPGVAGNGGSGGRGGGGGGGGKGVKTAPISSCLGFCGTGRGGGAMRRAVLVMVGRQARRAVPVLAFWGEPHSTRRYIDGQAGRTRWRWWRR